MCLWLLRDTGVLHLWLSRVLVGLDEDLADADVFANSPQGGLHGLPGTEDGHPGDLRGIKTVSWTNIKNWLHWKSFLDVNDVSSPSSHGRTGLHNPPPEGSAPHGSIQRREH